MLRRTPLKRGDAELSREAPLRRLTAMKRANAKRRAEAFEEDFGGQARVRWVQAQECCVCGAWPSVNAHVRSRGAGGKSYDIAPMCEAHHREYDAGVETFYANHPNIDLGVVAYETEVRWLAYLERTK